MGARVDALDSIDARPWRTGGTAFDAWCEAEVTQVEPDRIRVHFLFWDTKWDVWMERAQWPSAVAPAGTHAFVGGGTPQVGQRVDCFDVHPESNTWLVASIVGMGPRGVKVHYKGYKAEIFDEWIPSHSKRIAPFGHCTKRESADYKRLFAEEEEDMYLDMHLEIWSEALALARQEHGAETDHPSIATSLFNLAGQYTNRGRYDKAEPLLLEALAMRRRLHGAETDHPGIAHCLNTLAVVYAKQGRYDEAEPLFAEALEMWRCLHGAGNDHPSIAISLTNLSMMYADQKRYDEAELLAVEALAMRTRMAAKTKREEEQKEGKDAGANTVPSLPSALARLQDCPLESAEEVLSAIQAFQSATEAAILHGKLGGWSRPHGRVDKPALMAAVKAKRTGMADDAWTREHALSLGACLRAVKDLAVVDQRYPEYVWKRERTSCEREVVVLVQDQ